MMFSGDEDCGALTTKPKIWNSLATRITEKWKTRFR